LEEQLKQLIELEKLLFQKRYESWTYTIFSLRWWILVICLILPWFIWYALIDKKRIQEMSVYSLATLILGIMLDEAGATLTFWTYPVNVVPFFPRMITVNYSMVPVIFTLLYQYFPSWKAFIAVNIVLTLVFSFILEPILVWAKLYKLITWKYSYSVPVYFISAISLRLLVEKIKAVQMKYKSS
jgi:hypothetical protein